MAVVPENFLPVWQRVVRYDAVPTLEIAYDDPEALRLLTDSLLAFAVGRDLWIDSALLASRPEHVPFGAINDALRRHFEADSDLLACVVGRPEPVWAVIEDEYFWLVFEDA